MINRNALRASFAAGALVFSGCGEKEVGNTIAAGKGECVPMKGSLDLAPNQRVFIGGDVKFGGNKGDGRAINDRVQNKNVGNHVLEVNRMFNDGGTFSYGDSNNEIFTLKSPGPTSEEFTYSENSSTTTYTMKSIAKQHISLKFDTTC